MKNNHIKRAQRQLDGLIIEWSDRNPLAESPEIISENITHRQPLYRLKSATIWSQFKQWICGNKNLLWRVDFTLVFKYENGAEQHESRRVISRFKLLEIASECEKHVREAMNYGENFSHAAFKVECLGNRAATNDDFGDYQ